MSNSYARSLVEMVATVGVIFSLVFVGLELRQSTIASRASAYQELGIATQNAWYVLAKDRELNDLAFKIINGTAEEYEELSVSDQQRLTSYMIGILRLYETVYLQVEQGLLAPEALNTLGWEGFGSSNVLKIMWPDLRPWVGESFARYIEEIQPLEK